jgi:hypothetical protein
MFILKFCFLAALMACVSVIISLPASASERGQDIGQDIGQVDNKPDDDDFARFKPAHPWRDRLEALTGRSSQVALGAGALAVIGSSALDGKANNYFNGHKRIGQLNRLGNEVLGAGVPGLLFGGSFWLYGHIKERPYEIQAGKAQLETIAVTGATVALLKSFAGRKRPDGSDDYSFPSAHAAYAFATATVLGEFYGWKVGVPAYLLAGLTAAGRMQDNRHWLSDTVGGAAIAFVVGQAFSRTRLKWHEQEMKQKEEQEKSALRFMPELIKRPKTWKLCIKFISKRYNKSIAEKN